MPANDATNSSFYGTTFNFKRKTGRRLVRWGTEKLTPTRWMGGQFPSSGRGGDVPTMLGTVGGGPTVKKIHTKNTFLPKTFFELRQPRQKQPGTALGPRFSGTVSSYRCKAE